MSKKDSLLKEAADLQKQADQLRQRRKALQDQKAKAEENVKAWGAEASAALLDGQDSSKLTEQIGRGRAELEALNGALEQAESKIRDLAAQAEDTRKRAKASESGEYSAQAERITVGVLDAVREIVSQITEAERLYEVARDLAPLEWQGDSSVIMRNVLDVLRDGVLQGPDGLAIVAKNLEESYYSHISAVRRQSS